MKKKLRRTLKKPELMKIRDSKIIFFKILLPQNFSNSFFFLCILYILNLFEYAQPISANVGPNLLLV